jgi:hypothetical protein
MSYPFAIFRIVAFPAVSGAFGSDKRRYVKEDIQFVDAVSGTPLWRENRGYVPQSSGRMRRSSPGEMLLAVFVLIIVLAFWAFFILSPDQGQPRNDFHTLPAKLKSVSGTWFPRPSSS